MAPLLHGRSVGVHAVLIEFALTGELTHLGLAPGRSVSGTALAAGVRVMVGFGSHPNFTPRLHNSLTTSACRLHVGAVYYGRGVGPTRHCSEIKAASALPLVEPH